MFPSHPEKFSFSRPKRVRKTLKGAVEDWEREVEEEEERRRRERERDLEEKPRNDFAKEKETEAGRCPHCFM